MARSVVPANLKWIATSLEGLMAVLCVIYLITANLWVLIAWEVLGLFYVIEGFIKIWPGKPLKVIPEHEAKEIYRWTWVSNVLAALAGIYSAVVALSAQSHHDTGSVLLSVLASAGIALSWTVLHVGFAEIYQVLDSSTKEDEKGISFPDGTNSMLNYVYFSFTIAVSFATSDPTVVSVPVRRVVLIQSILSFFYNAIVVAVAIQVIQSYIGG